MGGRRRRWLAGLAVWFLAVSCARPPASQPQLPATPAAPASEPGDPAETARFQSPERHFSIALPTDWQVMPGYQGTAVTAFGPAPEPDADRPVLNVAVEPLTSPMDLATYVRTSRERRASSLSGFSETASGEDTLSGYPAAWVLGRYRLDSGVVKAKVHFVVVGDEAVVITVAAAPEHFEALAGRFGELISSFKYLPGPSGKSG